MTNLISLRKAFRVSENEVRVLYVENETRYEFLVEWNNIRHDSGQIGDYDLQLECLSDNELLREKVIEAIREGEEGENGDLYIEIRDNFDRMDAEYLD